MATNPISRAQQTSTGAVRLTSRPQTFGQRVLSSAAVWLVLMVAWALTDLLTSIFPPAGRPIQPDDWLTHLIVTAVGLAAVWGMHRTGFPAAWDARLPATRRLLLPALFGMGLGLLAIGIEEVTGATKILEAKMGTAFTVAFPGSLWVYAGGAIKWEALLRLLPVPLLLWLISGGILRGRGQDPTFWVLAGLSSTIEPMILQGVPLLVLSEGAISAGVFAAYAVHSFTLNFTAAVSFRRYGLLAAVLVRLAYYLVWHVGYGNFLA